MKWAYFSRIVDCGFYLGQSILLKTKFDMEFAFSENL